MSRITSNRSSTFWVQFLVREIKDAAIDGNHGYKEGVGLEIIELHRAKGLLFRVHNQKEYQNHKYDEGLETIKKC